MDFRPAEDETLDSFCRGRILVLQKKKGYRFSVDAPLLGDFVRTTPAEEALEAGTGCGIVSLLVASRPVRSITALEVQPGLAEMARRNVAVNGLGGRIAVLRQDYRSYRPGRTFDVVYSNPPYVPCRTGLLSPSSERSVARHELSGGVADILRMTAEWLAPAGRGYFVFPERRRPEFAAAAREAGLSIAATRDVHHRYGRPASLFLAEVRRGPGEGAPRVLAPLVLYNGPGLATGEAESIFQGRTAE